VAYNKNALHSFVFSMADESSGAGHATSSGRIHSLSPPQEMPSSSFSVRGSNHLQQDQPQQQRT